MGHSGQSGIEVVGVGMLLEPRGMGVCQALATDALGLCHFEAGYGDHPCMQLHASPVSFGDGKGQWVISWTAVVLACECHVPGFYLTGIDDTSTHARLKKYGIYAESLQLVQHLRQFLLLLFYPLWR